MASVRKRKWTHKGIEKEAWVVSYTDPGGTRRIKTFEKKRDADSYRTKVESEIERGDHIAASQSLTVAAVCNEFMKHADQRVRDGLIGRNRRMQLDQSIRHHIEPHLGNRLISELTVIDIERWYAELSAKPKSSLASRSIYLEALRRVEEFAFRRGYVKRKPVRDFKTERGSTRREVIKTFDVDQIGAILAELEHRPKGFTRRQHLLLKIAVHLACFCGMRRGEIFGLTQDNIDIGGRTIHIRHSLTVYNELKGPKTRSGIRDVPMPQHLQPMFIEWMDEHYLANDRELIFTSRSGQQSPFTSSLHHSWVKLLERAGIQAKGERGYHFHALRHFAASWAMEMGMSPPDVAALLGHRTFDLTLQVYAHPVYKGARRHQVIDENASRLIAATQPDATPERQRLLTN